MVASCRAQAKAIYRASWFALLLAMLATALEPAVAQTPPTVSSATVNGTQLTIQFSESLTSTSSAVATDFTVNLGSTAQTISAASVSSGNVVLTLGTAVPDTECTSDSVTVSYTANGSTLTGSGGGAVAAFSNQTVTNGTDAPPAITSVATDATGRYIYVTFCEPIDNLSYMWSGTDFNAFNIMVNNEARLVEDLLRNSTNTSRLEIKLPQHSLIQEGQTVTVAYDKSKGNTNHPLKDLDQGGKLVDSWSARTVTNTVDNPPSLVSVTALWDVITLTYSEDLNEDSVPDKSAFQISDKPYSVEIESVAVSDKAVTLATSYVIRGSLSPQFQLGYDAPSTSPLQQADGAKNAPNFHSQEVVSSTPTTKPTFQSAAVNGATLTITFDLPLKSVAAASAFAVGGVTGVTVSSTSYSGKVVTLMLSPAVTASDSVTIAYTKPNSPPRIEARNIKDADTFSAKAVTNNTPDPAPAFSSAVINNAGDKLTITMSKDLLTTAAGTPAASAFTITGGTAAITAVAVSGTTVALTLSPKADEGETITIAYAKPTGAGADKLQSKTGGHVVASWTAQSITNNADGKPRPTLATANGPTLSINFDRALDTSSVPDKTTFTIAGTTATVSSVAIAGSTVTLTLSPAVAHTDTITVAYTKPTTNGIKRTSKSIYTDTFTTLTVTNNTPDPTPTFSSASINAPGDKLTITMSKALLATTVGTPSKIAFTISGGTAAVTAVAVSGKTVALTLSPKADEGETITIAYTQPTSGGKLQSKSGAHLVATWTAQSVTNNADGKPRPTSATVNGATLAITFDRALDTSSTPATTDFAINGTTATVSSVAVSGSTATLTLSTAVAHDATITVSYVKPNSSGFKRSGKAIYTDSFTALNVANNTPDPTPMFSSASTNTAGDKLTITMTKDLLITSAGIPATSAFTITGGTAAITAVAVSGKTATLTLSPQADQGETITIAYAKPTGTNDGKLQSATGGHLVASWTGQSVTNDADGKPRATSATVNGTTLAITFDRALDTSSVPGKTTFTIAGTTATISSVAIAGSTVTLTLSAAVAHTDTITLDYTKPTTNGIKRSNKATYTDTFTTLTVTNNTPDPTPTFSAAAVNTLGDKLTITMSKDLLTTTAGTPDKSAFTIAGGTAAITAVAVSGKTVSLTLSPKADQGETITIAYAKPTGTNDGKLQSATGGHLVASWTGQSVTNNADGKPRPSSATVNGATLTITFDRTLDASSVPDASAFAIIGITTTVSNVAISNQTLTLTIDPPATHANTISVDYTKPSQSPLRRSGNTQEVDTFSGQTTTNVTPDPTPRFASAAVDADGATLTVTMSHALLETSNGIPATSVFNIGGTTSAAVSSVAVNSTTVTLTLAPAADLDETITLTYTPPSGAETAKLQSAQGTWQTPAWSAQPVANGADGVPRLSAAMANGNSVSLTFDRALDETKTPPAAAFTLTPTGTTVSDVAVKGPSVALTLASRLSHSVQVTVSYAANQTPTLTRASSVLTVASFSDVAVSNDTPAPPTISSAIGDGRTITLTFSSALDDESVPSRTAFSLGANQPTVSTVAISGRTLSLTLSAGLSEGSTYSVSYVVPQSNPLQSKQSAPIPAFTRSIANNTDTAPAPTSATGDGQAVTIVFDQALDTSSAIPNTAFSVTADPEEPAVTIASVSHGDKSLALTLSRSLSEGETGSVAYSKPPQDGIADASGNRTVSFTLTIDNQTDTAPVPVSGTVNEDTITITLDQEIYDDPRFHYEDGYPVGHFTLSGTTSTMTFVQVSNEGPGGHGLIVITLDEAVGEGDSLSIRYFPSTGSIKICDDQTCERRAEINNYALTNLTDYPPKVVSADLDATTLTVTFDQDLDTTSKPASTVYSLSYDGPSIASSSISSNTLTLTLAKSAIEDASYTLTYTPPATGGLRDATDNTVAGFAKGVTNSTDYAPYPILVLAEAEGQVLGAAGVRLQFDQPIDPSGTIDHSWFSFDPELDIDSAAIDSTRTENDQLSVKLAAGEWIREGMTLALTYTQPPTGGLVDDDAGNRVGTFTKDVANNVDVAPVVATGEDGKEKVLANAHLLTIEFDQDLNPDYVPPANCEELEDRRKTSASGCVPDVDTWFVVKRNGVPQSLIAPIEVHGRTVTIRLKERVAPDDTTTVIYTSRSLEGLDYNLRDTSPEPNHVKSTNDLDAINVTAATAMSALIDRQNSASTIKITFDGELQSQEEVDISVMEVTVDGKPVEISNASSTGTTLTITLSADVPECAMVQFFYYASDGTWRDGRGYKIQVIRNFPVANLIDADWGLQCVEAVLGGVVLTFAERRLPEDDPTTWTLMVDEGNREFTPDSGTDNTITLTPTSPVCLGNEIAITYTGSGGPYSLDRTISAAAPCAVSAVANRTTMTVTFDQPLTSGSVRPTPADFTLTGSATIEAVQRTEGRVLTHQLSAPGLHKSEQARLSYSGSTLQGNGLTVAPFELDVFIDPAPPKLESAIGFRSWISLQFDQQLVLRSISAARFIPHIHGHDDLNVHSVEVSGSSVLLELSRDLPDEEKLFVVVYLARASGGLESLLGARVTDSVFIVDNLTETAPTVESAVADAHTITITFDQQINAIDAKPSDFTVVAGRRTIAARSLEWSSDAVSMELEERITSLDAVRLIYAPETPGSVRDLSGMKLESFEFRTENRTPLPRTVQQKVKDAALRSSSGETTFARELARGFATDDGIRATAAPGEGWTRFARLGLTVSVDAASIGDSAKRIYVQPLAQLASLMTHLETTPSSCWNSASASDASGASAWWIGQSDVHGVPTDLSARVRVSGSDFDIAPGSYCVLDLLSGEWRLPRWPETFVGPLFILERSVLPAFRTPPYLVQ